MNSRENEMKFYNYIIDKAIESKDGGDLKELQELIQLYSFDDMLRYTFLMGLIYGALMQFNKKIAIEELQEFKKF